MSLFFFVCIASVLGATGYIQNVNINADTTSLTTAVATGIYSVTGEVSADKPFVGGCSLRVMPYNQNTITQILEKGNPKKLAIRTITSTGELINNWKEFTLSDI